MTHTLLNAPAIYKPMKYEWAFQAWKTQQEVHWLAKEVPLADDVKDWQQNLTDAERNLVTQIFRFFTQSDIEVAGTYAKYLGVFKPTEVLMMLSAFINIETVHIEAYAYLLDTIGMPETEYSAFLKYAEMKEKHDYLQGFKCDSKTNIALTLAAFGAFAEGMALFASFAMLLNFPRFNKMRGMGQIVSWSIRDESLHCESMAMLFKTFLQENPEIDTPELRGQIVKIAREMVDHEFAFIDLAFEMGPVQGLDAQQVKDFIQYIADRRLVRLGLEPIYHVEENPLPWFDEMTTAVEHASFFENRSTEYSKASTEGDWGDVFG